MRVASGMHLEFYHRVVSAMSRWVRFFGRARDSFERETRFVTQSGDRRPVDFDKRADAILPESGSFVRFGSANRNSRQDDPILDQPAIFRGDADVRTIAHRKIEH